MDQVRIGTGAGFAGDRVPPAVEMAKKGDLDFLVFECLAERTLMLAQLRRMRGGVGFDPMLEERLDAVLPHTLGPQRTRHCRILSNMGAADPLGAQQTALKVARKHGLRGARVAAIEGDDVLELLHELDAEVIESGARIRDLGEVVISANAYIGADRMIEALDDGADIILAGRVADPSLYLAPLAASFSWGAEDWDRLAAGTAVGHMLECAALSTGGFFADPGMKEVPGLADVGFPLAEVDESGSAIITKPRDTGGIVDEMTCKEQMLYEIHDPSAYLTPDVTANFQDVHLRQMGADRVALTGIRGTERPRSLKVVVGLQGGFIGEGEISYAGPNALGRARLAADVVRERLSTRYGWDPEEVRCDIIGYDALMGQAKPLPEGEPREVRLRVAARATSERRAAQIGEEVEPLYGRGPAGGGGVRTSVRAVLEAHTTFVDRDAVTTRVRIEEA